MTQTRQSAALELQSLAQLDRRDLRALPAGKFLHGWRALLFLFPGLHPDNALNHGRDREEISPDQLALPGYEQWLAERYARSGWPVALELLGHEAWRRFESSEILAADFYCVESQRAGMTANRVTEEEKHGGRMDIPGAAARL